jgi:hypothetical protein
MNDKYREDPNYQIFFEDCINRREKYPYVFDGYDEKFVCFWHSDENHPFLEVAVDRIVIVDNSDVVELYSRDYSEPIASVYNYSFWKVRK